MEITAQRQLVTTAVARKKRGTMLPLPNKWYVHLILITCCIAIGIPLIYAMIVSTQTNAEVSRFILTPGSSLGDNFAIVASRNLFRTIGNSIFVAISITIGKTILSLLAGLAFVYFKFPGKWIVFGFVLITLMMPTEILILALLRLISDMGLGNTAVALILPFMASATGTFLFRQHFSNIPAELSEAAQLDGATPVKFLISILIPISWNTIGALAVIQFVYAWNMYLWPQLVISDQSRQVVQVGLQALSGMGNATSFGPMMLGAVIASIPPILVFVVLQRQFMSGFAMGQEK